MFVTTPDNEYGALYTNIWVSHTEHEYNNHSGQNVYRLILFLLQNNI